MAQALSARCWCSDGGQCMAGVAAGGWLVVALRRDAGGVLP